MLQLLCVINPVPDGTKDEAVSRFHRQFGTHLERGKGEQYWARE